MHLLAENIMAVTFWDLEGILLMDCMPHRMIDGGAYAAVPWNLEAIKGIWQGVVLLLYDTVHRSRKAATIMGCGFEELNHPAYTSHLSTSDYFLF
jgi:hypothetical protein